jgi:hypothetical protein
MATPHVHNVSPMQPNINNPGIPKPDVDYSSSAPMQSVLPPSYLASAPPPPPPPYAISTPMQPPLYPQLPVLFTQMQVPYHGVIITGNFIPPQTANISDYMVWSIVNVFLGGFLLGLIAVLLSAQTKKRKIEGDVEGARTLSKVTLTCNILITIIFFGLTAFFIIYYVITLSYVTGYKS